MVQVPNGVNGGSAHLANGFEKDADLNDKLHRWGKRLGALPSLALPTDYPRPSEC